MPPRVVPASPVAQYLPEPERLINTPLLVPKGRPVAPGGIHLAEYSTMAPLQYAPEVAPAYRGSVATTRGPMHMAPPPRVAPTPAESAAVAAAIAREHVGTAEQPRRRKRRP